MFRQELKLLDNLLLTKTSDEKEDELKVRLNVLEELIADHEIRITKIESELVILKELQKQL